MSVEEDAGGGGLGLWWELLMFKFFLRAVCNKGKVSVALIKLIGFIFWM